MPTNTHRRPPSLLEALGHLHVLAEAIGTDPGRLHDVLLLLLAQVDLSRAEIQGVLRDVAGASERERP